MFVQITTYRIRSWNQNHMKKPLLALVALLTVLVQGPVRAQTPGTLTVALQQNVDVNGRPLAGCLVYIYIAGTVGSPQAVYTNPGLSVLAPNPLTCDQTGRVPMFYLGASSVHVRLTDAFGVQVYDYSSMIVLGQTPTGSGGGGGAGHPPTVAANASMKFRASSEVLAGWVTLNGTTIGSATSGGTQRANADTQALFQYLWANC